jgi:hypothetical protein
VEEHVTKKRAIVLVGVVLVAVIAYIAWPRGYCRSAESRFAIMVATCPSGTPRPKLGIRGDGLRRGGTGTVAVSAQALYTVADASEWSEAQILRFSVRLALVDAAGGERAIDPVPDREGERWRGGGGERVASVALPEVPDGDYQLRATVRTALGESSVDLPLALYAPARIHVITDRPLYRPGDTVSFRALALRATDLAPIEQRPGAWLVEGPGGEVYLEEKAPAGPWGVVAGDFPLDGEADAGEWTVRWRSGGTEAARTFRVEPFALPRFRVEAAADRPFYGALDTPVVRGAVVYSSGAPVAGAAVTVRWSVDSDGWPAPTSWGQGALPAQATTGANGRFALTLPPVPADLQGQVRLVAAIAAVDPAGDRVGSSATVLLSEDAIRVQAITELAGGLVGGFNNRVYLRVTTADGRPLPGVAVNVGKAWTPGDPGIDAILDDDAVARVQLDPGPPVNVVVPGKPVRSPPAPPVVTRVASTDLITGEPPSLADQLALDTWHPALARCATWVTDEAPAAAIALAVDERGAITATDGGSRELDRCVLAAVRGRRLSAADRRLLTIEYRFDDSGLPSVIAEVEVGLDDTWRPDNVALAALDARDCVPADAAGPQAWTLTWQVAAGSRELRTTWNPVTGETMSPALRSCLQSRLAARRLSEPAQVARIGIVRFSVEPAATAAAPPPAQPTIMQGYELLVTARADGKTLGQTRLRLAPGSVPPLRLRATPVLARPGETVAVELVRGPDYQGEIPKKLVVSHQGNQREVEIGKQRTASVVLPADARGWYELSAGGVRALVYVRSGAELAVEVTPDKPSYPPGAAAILAVRTALGGTPAPAAVGLFGVDESLGQLAPLPGADDLGSVRPEIAMTEPAFGVLDAQALTLGRIRGTSAAEATVLRVESIPSPAALDAVVAGSAWSVIDPIAELTDRFYAVLGELHAQTRAWERAAPPDEHMTPRTMAKLWDKALDAAKARGVTIEDAFGRRLRLHFLPPALLALTDPRQVVIEGTRLTEDVENWAAWVAKEKP